MNAKTRRMIAESVSRVEAEMHGFLRDLIRIPTCNPPGLNYGKVADFVEGRLRELGYSTRSVAVPNDELERLAPHSEGGERVSVIASIGGGPGPKIHLNGHVDTVGVGEGWTVDPFSAEFIGEKMVGLGASDMKSGLAVQVYAVEALRRIGLQPRSTITQSFTPDEETGGFAGVGYLVDEGLISTKNTDLFIITEPTNARDMAVGIRGAVWLDLTVHGRKAHSSMPFLGVNAFERGAEALLSMREGLRASMRKRAPDRSMVPKAAGRPSATITSVTSAPHGNVVPDLFRARIDRRLVRGETAQSAKKEVVALVEKSLAKRPGLRHEFVDVMSQDPIVLPNGSRAIAALRSALSASGRRPREFLLPATCDLKYFVKAGIKEGAIYGPGLFEQAHMANEYVTKGQLNHAANCLAVALAELAPSA